MYNIIISCFSLHRIALLHNTDAVSVLRENGFLEVYAIKKLIKKLCSGISVGCVAFVAIILYFPFLKGVQMLSSGKKPGKAGSSSPRTA